MLLNPIAAPARNPECRDPLNIAVDRSTGARLSGRTPNHATAPWRPGPFRASESVVSRRPRPLRRDRLPPRFRVPGYKALRRQPRSLDLYRTTECRVLLYRATAVGTIRRPAHRSLREGNRFRIAREAAAQRRGASSARPTPSRIARSSRVVRRPARVRPIAQRFHLPGRPARRGGGEVWSSRFRQTRCLRRGRSLSHNGPLRRRP